MPYNNHPLGLDLLNRILRREVSRAPELSANWDNLAWAGRRCPWCRGDNDGAPRIQSSGMGVESVAILLRWLREPASRDFCLCQLTVLTAQTGDEYADTGALMERYILPLYAYYGIRFVECARGGLKEKDGIEVLQDTRRPVRTHLAGAFKLSAYLRRMGTVPQVGGEHRCSLKWKAFVLEHWLANYFHASAWLHCFGYNADEKGRAGKCLEATQHRNEVGPSRMAFGFNRDELNRAARTNSHDQAGRESFFPLIEWGWPRAQCLAYIEETLGVIWPKSACVFCPFSQDVGKATPAGLARLSAHPEAAAEALLLEYGSLCLNPRGRLFNTKSLASVIQSQPALYSLWEGFVRLQDSIEWSLLEVKRHYTAPGQARRSVLQIASGAREAMTDLYESHVAALELAERVEHGIRYGYFAERRLNAYPSAEGYLVVAPAEVEEKARGSFRVFEERYTALLRELGQPLVNTPGTNRVLHPLFK